ncbi:hypothetical protein BH09BAC3_BH09BAC3_37930 [soil metagenome]
MKKPSIKKPLKDKTELGSILGDRVGVRKVNGGVIVTNRPIRKRGKPSAKLLAQRARFKKAVVYGKRQEADKEASALYARGIKTKHESVYSVALGDFMNPPEVKSIDAIYYQGRIDDIIQIEAADDFMVTRVTVTITDGNGGMIEQGLAIENLERINSWEYKATASNPTRTGTKIRVIAEDKPGNKDQAEIVL